jgi:hypothetical protein
MAKERRAKGKKPWSTMELFDLLYAMNRVKLNMAPLFFTDQ